MKHQKVEPYKNKTYYSCEKYYAKTTLFENFRNATPWPLLDCDILDHYLPKSQQSCDVIFVSFEQPLPLNKIEKLEFSSLDLFEVRRHDKGKLQAKTLNII